MKILVDFHHADLFHSLSLLFDRRLGWEVYRPVGLEWYKQGYWKVFDALDTARQFLDLSIGCDWNQIQAKYPNAHFEPLNKGAIEISDNVFVIPDVTKDTCHRGITLEQFRQENFDVLLSSIPEHIAPYNELIRKFQPGAKHIFQVGNAWGALPGVKNILSSTAPFSVPVGINACFYHQEFDLDDFCYEPPVSGRPSIYSYIHYMKDANLFGNYAQNMPDFHFRSYGAGMGDNIMKTAEIAKRMRSSAFTWHYKPEGDGFGHILHNTMAVGRPPLIWKSHYIGKLADSLLIDGVTCIDMSLRPLGKNITLMRDLVKTGEHVDMCYRAQQQFKKVVNYDTEETQIRNFLERLL